MRVRVRLHPRAKRLPFDGIYFSRKKNNICYLRGTLIFEYWEQLLTQLLVPSWGVLERRHVKNEHRRARPAPGNLTRAQTTGCCSTASNASMFKLAVPNGLPRTARGGMPSSTCKSFHPPYLVYIFSFRFISFFSWHTAVRSN